MIGSRLVAALTSLLLLLLPARGEVLCIAMTVHDFNRRAMTKRVQGFVSAQSWLLDLTLVTMR